MNAVFNIKPEDATQDNYTAALKAHDWSHEYSDDHSVWSRGRGELGWLQAVAKLLDPHHAIWNHLCPEGYQRKKSP